MEIRPYVDYRWSGPNNAMPDLQDKCAPLSARKLDLLSKILPERLSILGRAYKEELGSGWTRFDQASPRRSLFNVPAVG